MLSALRTFAQLIEHLREHASSTDESKDTKHNPRFLISCAAHMLSCYTLHRESRECWLPAHYALMSCLLMKMESIYFVSTKGSAGLITALQQQNENRKCSITLVWHFTH